MEQRLKKHMITRGQKNIINVSVSPKESPHLVFLTKIFIQASLPHKDPGDIDQWVRTNGGFSLRVSQGEMTTGTETIISHMEPLHVFC